MLKIGNCLNAGNKQKGQADGFDISDVEKCFTLKDINGRSIMRMICEKMFEKDEKVGEFKEEFEVIYKTLKSNLKDITTEIKKAKGTVSQNKQSFDIIQKLDPELEDIQFGKQISVFIVKCEKRIDEAFEILEKADKEYVLTCNYMMLTKMDEKREKSDKFFAFWAELFTKIDKEMPKAKAPPKNKMKAAMKKSGANNALMAEL